MGPQEVEEKERTTGKVSPDETPATMMFCGSKPISLTRYW